MYRYILSFLAIAICTITLAQEMDSTKKMRVTPLPSVFYTPETSWGFGATILGFYKPKDTTTRKSNAQVFLDFTLMRQASFQSDFNVFTKGNRFYIKGSHDLSKFPEFYYGIGNENKFGTGLGHRAFFKRTFFIQIPADQIEITAGSSHGV